LLAFVTGGSGYVGGEPVVFREFVTAMLATQGVIAPSRSVPLVAVRAALALVGQEMTVSDAKARRELGYRPVLSVDEGFAELHARAAA
jgi:nucleoside-diphosphate-sugar epimerase